MFLIYGKLYDINIPKQRKEFNKQMDRYLEENKSIPAISLKLSKKKRKTK